MRPLSDALAELAARAGRADLARWLRGDVRGAGPRYDGPVGEHPSTVDLASGAGLFSLAFLLEGMAIAEACDLNPWALASYDATFNDVLTALGHELPGRVIPRGKRRVRLAVDLSGEEPIGGCDARAWRPEQAPGGILIGGPPCQPFSEQGLRAGERDPRDLFGEIPRLVELLRPRVVVMENVSGVLEDRHADYWRRWWGELAALGYEGTVWSLLAADYGTPQYRPRVFFVCWPVSAPWGRMLRTPPAATHAHPKRAAALGLIPWVSGFERLAGGCCRAYGLLECFNLNNLYGQCETCDGGSRYVHDVEGEEGGGPVTTGMVDFLMRDARDGGRRLLDRRKPLDAAGTRLETAACEIGPAGTGHLAPAMLASARASKLGPALKTGAFSPVAGDDWTRADVEALEWTTLGDAKRIMDLPTWFVVEGPHREAFAQLGNGVPLNLGRAIARHVRAALGLKLLPEPTEAGLWPAACATIRGGTRSATEQSYTREILPDGWSSSASDRENGWVLLFHPGVNAYVSHMPRDVWRGDDRVRVEAFEGADLADDAVAELVATRGGRELERVRVRSLEEALQALTVLTRRMDTGVQPHKAAHEEGRAAFLRGEERKANPYDLEDDRWFAWDSGWGDALHHDTDVLTGRLP